MASTALGTSIVSSNNADTNTVVAGEAVITGDVLYKSSSDKKYYKAIASGTAEQATFGGIAISEANVANQEIVIHTEGDLTGLSGKTEGQPVFISGTVAGQVELISDLITSNEYITYIGTFTSATTASIKAHNTGAQIA